jgi:hypothetical protein
VLYPPVKSGHLLIDGATLASVIGKKLSAFSAMQNVDDGSVSRVPSEYDGA